MKPYTIYILKYARRDAHSSELVMGDYEKKPTELPYFMWVATNGEHTVAIDMGFTEPMAKKRKRQWLRDPAALYDSVKIDPRKIQHVVISHMHWDHVGNYDLFPKATFYLQEDEMAFWTGKYLKYPVFNASAELEDFAALVRFNQDGRIGWLDGPKEIVPGITIHKVGGGHTKGIQIVQVQTASGSTVLASDAAHVYRNFQENKPFLILHDIPNYVEGFELMRRLAKDDAHILPGHDTEVMKRHRNLSDHVAVME